MIYFLVVRLPAQPWVRPKGQWDNKNSPGDFVRRAVAVQVVRPLLCPADEWPVTETMESFLLSSWNYSNHPLELVKPEWVMIRIRTRRWMWSIRVSAEECLLQCRALYSFKIFSGRNYLSEPSFRALSDDRAFWGAHCSPVVIMKIKIKIREMRNNNKEAAEPLVIVTEIPPEKACAPMGLSSQRHDVMYIGTWIIITIIE